MALSNSDFWIAAVMLSGFGGLGVWEGYEVHPVFFSQAAVNFGFIGYFWYQVFHLDHRETRRGVVSRSTNSEDSPSG